MAKCGQRRDRGTVSDFAKMSDLIVAQAVEKYARYFDVDSAWRGPGRSIAYGDILLVFLSREPGDFEMVLERMVVKAIKKAVVAASKYTGRYPDMVVCNDVDGFSSATLADAARAHGVCLVFGDQCQTLPTCLAKASTRFRSDHGQHFHDHYLLDDDGDRSASVDVWR